MSLHYGDGLPEDRVTCLQCRHSDPGQYKCRKLRTSILPDVPLRCQAFEPDRIQLDQRTGLQRWPTLEQDIAEARAVDVAWAHRYDKVPRP